MYLYLNLIIIYIYIYIYIYKIYFNQDKLKYESNQIGYKESIEKKLVEEITENDNIRSTITTLDRIIYETAIEILGISRTNNKPWITDDILDLCDERRKFKNSKNLCRIEYNLLNKNIKIIVHL